LARLQAGNGRPCSAGLDLAIFLISRRSDKVNLFGRPPEYYRNQKMRFIGDETTANAPASFEATSPEMVWKTIEQGAATSVLLAASPLLEGITASRSGACALRGANRSEGCRFRTAEDARTTQAASSSADP